MYTYGGPAAPFGEVSCPVVNDSRPPTEGRAETGLTSSRALNADHWEPDAEPPAPVRRTVKLRLWATDGRGVVKPTSDVADRSSSDTVVFPFTVNCGRIGTLMPNDYTGLNHSVAAAAGGVISTANDLATWIQALVAGRVLDAEYQRRWLDSVRPEDPNKPDGQRYGYGIAELSWGPNRLYFHGGETPGYNSFMGYDLPNQVTLVVWTNLTVSLDESPTANAVMLKVLDQIYVVSPMPSSTLPTAAP